MGNYLTFLLLAALAWLIWRFYSIPREVVKNVADFDADGANDTLQKGYHARRTWVRIWQGLACCVVPILPLVASDWKALVLASLAMDALMAGTFARWFTPLLNLARSVKRLDITEWTCSLQSKSWPDSKAAKRARNQYPPAPNLQVAANVEMERIVMRTWYWSLFGSAVLIGAGFWFTLHP